LNEIGSDLGLTAERIRQIEKQALQKLREAAAQPPTVIA
jgi:DNA-directed RNA polymerase sigma subunit (sigma70/sigma32)